MFSVTCGQLLRRLHLKVTSLLKRKPIGTAGESRCTSPSFWLITILVFVIDFPAEDDHRKNRPSSQHSEELASPTPGRKRVAVQRGDGPVGCLELQLLLSQRTHATINTSLFLKFSLSAESPSTSGIHCSQGLFLYVTFETMGDLDLIEDILPRVKLVLHYLPNMPDTIEDRDIEQDQRRERGGCHGDYSRTTGKEETQPA